MINTNSIKKFQFPSTNNVNPKSSSWSFITSLQQQHWHTRKKHKQQHSTGAVDPKQAIKSYTKLNFGLHAMLSYWIWQVNLFILFTWFIQSLYTCRSPPSQLLLLYLLPRNLSSTEAVTCSECTAAKLSFRKLIGINGKNPTCHAYSPKPKNYPAPKRVPYIFGGITVDLMKYYGFTYKSHPSFVLLWQNTRTKALT